MNSIGSCENLCQMKLCEQFKQSVQAIPELPADRSRAKKKVLARRRGAARTRGVLEKNGYSAL